MASQTGYYDARGFGEGIPPDLRSRDLPSKRLLGKGLASIGYETEWKGERYARLDFVGVPSDIFRHEAAALVRLKDVHENVVKTYGLTFDKLSCSLVSEYMDDKLSDLLQKRMDQRKRIPASTDSGNESEHISSLPFELQEALDLMLQTAKGMEYLHEQGILHGDLKTRNIPVTYMNNDDTKLIVKSVKLSDFGLAQTKRNSMSHVSRQARKLDMVRWKAPEILKESSSSESDSNSDEECTRSSGDPLRVQLSVDVYSFAMTCSQILTSEEPYPKRNLKGLVADIVSGKLRPKLPPSCPEMLSELLKLCWDTDPNKRPPFLDIRKSLEHLQRLQMGISNEAQKPIDAYQLEHVEKDFTADSSSLKPMELVGSNFRAPKAFDADISKLANSDPDPDALLRKGKAVWKEFPDPEEINPSVLTSIVPEGETLNDYYDSILNLTRPGDIRSSDQFRDDYELLFNVHHGSGTSTAMDETYEPSRPHKRRRKFSSVVTHDYDVFLSHRGPDVAHFVEHLHDALKAAGLNSFLPLIKGDPVFELMDRVLETAKVHVAIVSRGYVDSEYCLNEVVAMMRSGKPVIPVFYDVRPEDLSSANQGPFAAAFEKHKLKQIPGQVEEWRDALRSLLRFNGLVLAKFEGAGTELIYELVDAIRIKFVPKLEILEVDPHLVGLEKHVKTCISKLEEMSIDIRLLGIVGVGGIGKTSLAKAIYNHFIGQKKFQAMSFLEIDQSSFSSMEFGPSKPRRMQKQLLRDLLDIKDGNLQHYQDHFPLLSEQVQC